MQNAKISNAPSVDENLTRKGYMKAYRKTSRGREMWEIFRHNHLAMVGLAILIVILFFAIFANVIADYETVALKTNPVERFTKPCAAHIFGTDELGRDMFARVIHGARISLKISVGSVLVGLVFSAIVGSTAGYFGGKVDTVIMRVVDIVACVPSIVMAIAVVASFGSSDINLTLALGLATVAGMSRVVRSAVLSVRDMEYVEAARAIGQKTWKIVLNHILVNCVAPIIVQCTLMVAINNINVAGLSFLGLGVAAPAPEWGCMIAGARTNMRQYPYLVIVPGMAILLAAIGFNLVGDGLRDALDPKLKR